VSFIVPTRNTERTLRACLESLRAQSHPDVEIVVVDNHSDDATAAIARELADRLEVSGPERSGQRNHGACVSSGSVLVFADADMVFDTHVASEVFARLGPAGDPTIGALVIPERAFGSGYWARCRVLEKELYLGDPAVEAARAFRAEEFFDVGGYNETYVGPEDWDMADRATVAGRRVDRIDATVWHDEGRLRLRTAFRKKRYYGRGLALYLRAANHRHLPRRSLMKLRPLARKPHLAAGLAVLKTVEVSGGALGIAAARRQGANA
jgi:glycosyltransferase involved in cell wall biosynthesis